VIEGEGEGMVVVTVATTLVVVAVAVTVAFLAQLPAITSKANVARIPMTTHNNLRCLFICYTLLFLMQVPIEVLGMR
jgi:flagellar biogenesis protein FliO